MRNLDNIFLSQALGILEIKENYQWSDIYADLFITTKVKTSDVVFPKVNVYFEDKEAYDFFNRLKYVSMGCGNYKGTILKKAPEFSEKSIIVLDGDKSKSERKSSKKIFDTQKNIALLPTIQSPDRLLFKLPPNDIFWHNNLNFTKEAFKNSNQPQAIISRLELNQNNISDFDDIIEKDLSNQTKNGLREMFK